MPDLTVYTAIIGGYDYLKEPDFKGKYLAYVDPFYKNNYWQVKQAPAYFKDNTRSARMVKLLSHQFTETEWSLWIDGNFALLVSPGEILEKYGDFDLVMFNSATYHTIKEEADKIVELGKDSAENIYPQYEKYISEGYPDNVLSVTGCVLRRHTKKIIEFNNLWWSELCAHSKRDQMSVDYAAWKSGVKISYFEGSCYNSKEFNIYPHNEHGLGVS